ncbi:MAG TPA: amidohydrolase family protein, partial [Kofleriaceae bacterium]|nr:amidohydrolase family protein [Kofleriaceae bacterium]
GQDMIAHSEELFFTYFYGDTESRLDRGLAPEPDRSRIPWVVERLRRSCAAVTPNLSFVAMTARQLDDLDGVLGDPEARYLHPDVLQMWRDGNPRHRPDLERFTARERAKFPFLQELTRALARGGVPLLAGTDASAPGLFPGKSMHVELEELVRAGLTPAQALAAATTSASRFIQQHVRGADPFGSVEPGQRADLVLLGANPLADIRNAARITGVVVRGRWLTAEAIGSMRRAYGSR